MKNTKKVINKLEQVALNSSKNRILSTEILNILEKKGIDIDYDEFVNAWAYIEGDCSEYEIVSYLKSIKLKGESNVKND